MKTKPTVLYLINTLGHGGAEHLIVDTINATEKDYNNILVYLEPPHSGKESIIGAEIICLYKHGKRAAPSIIRSLRKIIKDRNVDIVTAHSYWTNIYSRLATPRRCGLVNTYHFADYDTMQGHKSLPRMIGLDKLTYSTRLQIVCVSKYVQDILARRCGYVNRIQTIENFVNDAFTTRIGEAVSWKQGTTLRLVAVGGTKREKNYELLIEAFKELKDLNVEMDVWGGGDMLDTYRQAVIENGIPNLHFKGGNSNIADILSQYHMYVMCSFSEACPLSPIEAMSVGLPMVLSDIPPLREIAGDHAVFFENRNACDFADRIKGIMTTAQLPEADLSFYRTRLERYSKSSYVTALDRLYQSLIDIKR